MKIGLVEANVTKCVVDYTPPIIASTKMMPEESTKAEEVLLCSSDSTYLEAIGNACKLN